MDEIDECNDIIEEAMKRYRQWSRRIRGQVVMPQDGLDYWVWRVSKERYGQGV
jgi:hypothetical protein